MRGRTALAAIAIIGLFAAAMLACGAETSDPNDTASPTAASGEATQPQTAAAQTPIRPPTATTEPTPQPPTAAPASTPAAVPTGTPERGPVATLAPTRVAMPADTPTPEPAPAPTAAPTETPGPISTPAPPPGVAHASDRDVLAALYNATNGADWENNQNWLTEAPIERWHGVATDGDGRVVDLNLRYNRLSGQIPPGLGRLANLEVLVLEGNQLGGQIPSELGSLSNLENLSLGTNRLNGEIPAELGRLSNLEVLWLPYNRFSGEIPPALGNLSNLERVALSNNQLSGRIPPELGSLSNLARLFLSNNRLSGSIPPELGSLSRLKHMSLAGNTQLTGCIPGALQAVPGSDLADIGLPFCDGAGPKPTETPTPTPTPTPGVAHASDRDVLAALYNATNGADWENNQNWLTEAPIERWHGVATDRDGRVVDLNLRYNRLSGQIPPGLGRLANLEVLVLEGNQLSGQIPPELGSLSNLENLSLGTNRLNGDIPAELGRLSNLEVLWLPYNRFSGEIPPALGNLSNLERVALSNNQLSGRIPPELGSLSNLTRLFLSNNRLSGGIPPELGSLSRLEHMSLAGNTQLTGCIPGALQAVPDSDLADIGLPFCDGAGPKPTETPTPTPTPTPAPTPTPTQTPTPVLQPALDITPLRGSPGDVVSVTGTNFPGLTAVSRIEIGGVSVIPATPYSTTADGAFNASVVVPRLDVGTYHFVVTVGDRSSTATFSVVESATTAGEPVAAALAPLGNNLLWAAYYDNATKQWSVYDPTGAFSPDLLLLPPEQSVPSPSSIGALTHLVPRKVYGVYISRDETVTLRGTARTLTAGINSVSW